MSFNKKAELAKQAAFNLIAEKIYNPVFFTKLAQYGIIPQTEEEKQQLLAAATEVKSLALQTFGSVDAGPATEDHVKVAKEILSSDHRVKSAAIVAAKLL